MHHQRLMALAVLADVLQAKALGQGEVELHGRELPQAADGVHQLDVDLGAVERSFAGNGFVLDVAALQSVLQRTLRQLPLIVAAGVGFAIVRIPGRQLDLELLEAVGVQRGQREVDAADHFVFNLLRRAEDVRVVLGKAAHAQQAVHHARTLVAIDRAHLAQPHRQVAIRLQASRDKSGCGTDSSSASCDSSASSSSIGVNMFCA